MGEIDDEVLKELAAVRETGVTNMHHRFNVEQVAEQYDFEELQEFLEDADNEEYMNALNQMGERYA